MIVFGKASCFGLDIYIYIDANKLSVSTLLDLTIRNLYFEERRASVATRPAGC